MQNAEHYVTRLLSGLIERPDHVVMWWRDQPIRAADFARAVTTAARVLRREGIGMGSTVALLLGNTPEMLIARYAANLVGATALQPQTFNAVNALDKISVDMQAAMLTDANTALLVVDAQNIDRARSIVAKMESRPLLAALTALEPAGASGLVDLSSPRETPPFELPTEARAGNALVTYTSGSAGRPKGVPRSFAFLGRLLTHFENTVLNPIMAITTPLHGQTATLMSDTVLSRQGTIVLLDGFDAGAVLAAIAKYRVTRLCVAPPQLYQLVDHPARAATDTSSLRQILYTGCTASPQRIARALEAFGPILTQAYGMTEAMGIAALGPAEHGSPKLLMTVGSPLPGVELTIRDPATDEILPQGQAGEICVRSAFVMDGYWRDSEATARALRGGWLHTGDVGYLDDTGRLHLVGRLASMIKARGIKVYPATVEDVLLTHPAVAQAAVYRVVDKDEVEHVYATVVPQRGRVIDPEELRLHVERKLSATHAPAKIAVRDALPALDSGKPDKRRLSFDAEVAAGWRMPEA